MMHALRQKTLMQILLWYASILSVALFALPILRVLHYKIFKGDVTRC